MTQAQQDAFCKIEELMREHFEAGVLVIETVNDDRKHETRSTWHGGYAVSLGLLELGKLQVWDKTR